MPADNGAPGWYVIRDSWVKPGSEYQRILKQLQEDENFGEKILVPTYVSYRDGDVYKYHVATLKDENDKYIKDLSDNQKEELKQIYLDLVK